jgi:hypothetical protein
MYQLLGIDSEGAMPNSKGLDVKVMPSSKETGGMLKEII